MRGDTGAVTVSNVFREKIGDADFFDDVRFIGSGKSPLLSCNFFFGFSVLF